MVDILLLLAASASWALGTIIAEGHKDTASSVALSGRELVSGGTALLLLSAWQGEPGTIVLSNVSLASLLAWSYLTLAGTVVAFGSYIWLLKRVSPTLVATYTFVNPVIAMLLGWAFLGEEFTIVMLLGGLMVIASVAGLLHANHRSKEEETNSWWTQKNTVQADAKG